MVFLYPEPLNFDKLETVTKKMIQAFWSVTALTVIFRKKFIKYTVIIMFSANEVQYVFVSYLSSEIWAKIFKFSFLNFEDFVKKSFVKIMHTILHHFS